MAEMKNENPQEVCHDENMMAFNNIWASFSTTRDASSNVIFVIRMRKGTLNYLTEAADRIIVFLAL